MTTTESTEAPAETASSLMWEVHVAWKLPKDVAAGTEAAIANLVAEAGGTMEVNHRRELSTEFDGLEWSIHEQLLAWNITTVEKLTRLRREQRDFLSRRSLLREVIKFLAVQTPPRQLTGPPIDVGDQLELLSLSDDQIAQIRRQFRNISALVADPGGLSFPPELRVTILHSLAARRLRFAPLSPTTRAWDIGLSQASLKFLFDDAGFSSSLTYGQLSRKAIIRQLVETYGTVPLDHTANIAQLRENLRRLGYDLPEHSAG